MASEEWQRLDAALSELTQAVQALKPDASGGPAPPPLPPPSAPPPRATSASAPSSWTIVPDASLPLPSAIEFVDNPMQNPFNENFDEELAKSGARKVPSIFASGAKADMDRCKRNIFPNIFAWNQHGGEGVEDDVSSLQLRATSRLLSRQQEILKKEADMGLGPIWALQRQEMREADLFLDAFDRNEAGTFPWLPAAPPPPQFAPGGRAMHQRWPPWHQPTKAEYIEELRRANPEGCMAAFSSSTPAVATVGVDTTGDGQANYLVSGADMNLDGIPDVLQGQVPPRQWLSGASERVAVMPERQRGWRTKLARDAIEWERRQQYLASIGSHPDQIKSNYLYASRGYL